MSGAAEEVPPADGRSDDAAEDSSPWLAPPVGPAAVGDGRTMDVEETFWRRWGDMAAAWGINRTMAEIQGLLYITGATMNTDDVMARLGVSRGNASMSLRALAEWGVVRKVHRPGDRRDYYESLSDVWEMFTRVAAQRKRREIDPILETLRECHQRMRDPNSPDAPRTDADRLRFERLERMLDFLATVDRLAEMFVGKERGLARAIALLFGGGK